MPRLDGILEKIHLFSSDQEKGKAFELFCKWFLENDPKYSAQLKQVWLWKDWPKNWGKDKGIDLIAETYTGEIWAVQAKCYDKNYYVTKKDIDKFLSESSRTIITYRLLICTTDLLGDNAREVIAGQEKQVGLCFLENLLESSLQCPASIEDLQPLVSIAPKTPWPHQEKAILDILEGFKKHECGQLYMACGTGKTLVGLWVSEQLNCQNTLVLVPSISLIAQIYQEWTANAVNKFIPIFICSDPTVSEKDQKDQMVTNRYELGFPTTTDPTEILHYFSATKGMTKVIFCTYHSSPILAQVCASDENILFDLTIADEAHRCAGFSDSSFATILKPEAIRTRHKLFMTATPKIFSEHLRIKGKELEYELSSMDDEKKFGPILHKLPFSLAISQNLLSDYQVLIAVMDNKTYREYAEGGKFVSIDRHKTNARTVAAQILVSKAIKKHSLQRIITFHNKKSAANEFISSFPEALKLIPKSEQPNIGFYGAIFGEMQQTKRKSLLKIFKDLESEQSGLLANVRCLSEGVDVPTLDGVAFIDPKGSQIDIIQAVGRAIRKAPNKKIGLIIIPIFIDEHENAVLNFDDSCFKSIWKVLNALRAHDDILAEELNYLRLELGRRSCRAPLKIGKITVDLPISIGAEFADSLNLKIVDRCSNSWEFYYGLLLRYIEENGKAPINVDLQYYGYDLGGWISLQRRNFNKKELDPLYISRLEMLPGWAWDALEAYWTKGFGLLKEFLQNHSHINVPFNHCIDDFNLSSWISVQRKTFKNKKMDPIRQLKLESIPGWSWKAFDALWEKGFSLLLAFYEKEKHINVSKNYSKQNFNLSAWIRNRKKDFEVKRLSLEKQKKLESLPNWTWESSLDAAWNKAFALLQKYTKETGHSRFPRGHKYEGFSLDTWVSSQRRAHFLGKLSHERKLQLESLPGWLWNVVRQRDEMAFQAINSFVLREGHSLIPTNHIENQFALGNWVSRHRLYYVQGVLEEELRLRLESYPGWCWNAHDGYWENGKNLLLKFCAREGHSRVKNIQFEDGFALGRWIGIWRGQYKKKTLPQWKIDFFESLPLWSWDVKADRWSEGFNILKQYIQREGHASVAHSHIETGFRLGIWVCTQKYSYAKQTYGKKLSHEKIKLLESLPGWVWDQLEDSWNQGYEYLKKFTEIHGHAKIPTKNVMETYKLGTWVSGQRYSYKKNKLSLERINLLEKLQGWVWDEKESDWEGAYELLLKFYRRENHAKVKYDHKEENFSLGEWIRTQRKSYKFGKIDKERIDKLEKLDGWFWNTKKE